MRWASHVVLACLLGLAASTASAERVAVPGEVLKYDAKRDAAKDIEQARALAATQHKRVMLAIGGDWCKDCRELDRVFAKSPDLIALRDQRFVLVKVFLGSENRNERVLAAYPAIEWVPTLIELDEGGAVARTVPSTEFHSGETLDPAKIRAFLETD